MLLLAGAMDGSVAILQADNGSVLWRHKAHAKYCVRVRWAADSSHFVSCSWDRTLCVFSHSPGTDGPEFKLLNSVTYMSQVQDVEFIPGAELSDQLLAVALKSTNYLRLFDMLQLKVIDRCICCLLLLGTGHVHALQVINCILCTPSSPHDRCVQEHSKVNMNAMGDDHVSFSASHLTASPCKKYLLVSTEGSRIIMFRVQGTLVRARCTSASFSSTEAEEFVLCRLDSGKEFLWFECGGEVSPTMCSMALQWFLHFCSSSSWHCHCVSCGHNQGMPRRMLTVDKTNSY